MDIDNKIYQFLELYKKIELEYITSNTINGDNVQKLMDISKEMIEQKLISDESLNFSSQKSFLNSVKDYINNLI